MIIKINKFGFKVIRYILEPFENFSLTKKYSLVQVLNYKKTNYPGFTRRSKKTPIINLGRSQEDIFINFNSTARNEIRRSEKINKLEFKILDNNIKEAYNIYAGHERAQGRKPERKAEFKGGKIFSAYYKKKMIAVIICFHGSDYLRAKSISSRRMENINREMLKIISFATRRLVWEICKYGKSNNYKGFDLGSINLTDSGKKGIAAFKQSFGAEIIDEYNYVYKNRIYRFISKLLN